MNYDLDALVPQQQAFRALAISNSTGHKLKKAGLLPPSFPISGRFSGFRKSEVVAVQQARAAGATDDDMRALVRAIIADRPAASHCIKFDPHSALMEAGRVRFWADVRAGKRPHPRTAGRLRREAAQRTAAEEGSAR